ncbi:LysR family transcriptional regulator [Celeribacter halophilus]|jgi:DNA-binding transcriptional LysR family regulator|uniref:LysR family transcriptional regulator n=1 Tax=Celeribacter halophilus TaxID=576117 RepID=UPI002FD2BD38
MALHLVPRGLQYVVAVAEHGSIQAASRNIDIAASAIDRQVKLIEERLGVPLFDRVPSGMALTPVGEAIVLLARRWQSDENRIWSDVKQMQGLDVGHFRLVAMDSLMNGVVPDFLGRIYDKYPRVRIDVDVATPDDAVDALSDGRSDIALVFNLRSRRDIHVAWSTSLPLHCVCAPEHPLAMERAVSLKQVTTHAIVIQSKVLAIRRMLEAQYSWIFSEDLPPVATNSLQLLKQLVVAGHHVALTSVLDVAPELLAGELVAIPVKGQKIVPQTISVAHSAQRVLPRVASMLAQDLATDVQALLREIEAVTVRA